MLCAMVGGKEAVAAFGHWQHWPLMHPICCPLYAPAGIQLTGLTHDGLSYPAGRAAGGSAVSCQCCPAAPPHDAGGCQHMREPMQESVGCRLPGRTGTL
jgi:hypothetical protein